MSVRIRLTRTGRKNLPSYRIAVFDTRTRRDGPALEVIGWFNPLSREAGKGFKIRPERLEDWVRRGARVTLAVENLLHRQGLKPTALAPAAAPAAASPAKKKRPAKKLPPKLDAAAKERRKRRAEKRAGRRAVAAKKAAARVEATRAAAKPAGAPAPSAPPAGEKV